MHARNGANCMCLRRIGCYGHLHDCSMPRQDICFSLQLELMSQSDADDIHGLPFTFYPCDLPSERQVTQDTRISQIIPSRPTSHRQSLNVTVEYGHAVLGGSPRSQGLTSFQV